MNTIENTKDIIINHERKYAAQLGRLIMEKPKLSSLMIFIPFLFIFYIQDLLKYKKARKDFSINFLLSREKALQEAVEVLSEDRKPDTFAIAEQAGLPQKSAKKYADYLEVLTAHYACLLKGKGTDYEALIRSAYNNNKQNFENFINRLTQSEISLNKTLKPKLKKDQAGVTETIKKIENGNNKLRRAEIELIF